MFKKFHKGVTLVELMVGSSILIFIMASFILFSKQVSNNTVDTSMSRRVSLKLNSVADNIRYKAIEEFADMTTTVPDCSYTGFTDSNIAVCASISPINANTRTRDVALTATFTIGNEQQVKTLNFNITQIRGKKDGAKLDVKVVKANDPSEGVPGIKVIVPGLDPPKFTDANGVAQFDQVRIDNGGVNVKVDGSVRQHYFINPSPTFVKDFPTGATKSGEKNLDLFTSPILIYPPGTISGTVVDVETSSPLENIILRLIPISGKTIIANNSIMEVQTDLSGQFEFKDVLPDKNSSDPSYLIYCLGNSSYTALASVDDKYIRGDPLQSNPASATHLSVASDQLVVRDFETIKRGSILGTVQGINFSNGSYRRGTPGHPDMHLVAIHPNFETNTSNHRRVSFGNSEASRLFDRYSSARSILVTKQSGSFEGKYLTPIMVEDNNNLTTQFNSVGLRPYSEYVTPADPRVFPHPFTPIIVLSRSGNPNPSWSASDTMFLSFLYPRTDWADGLILPNQLTYMSYGSTAERNDRALITPSSEAGNESKFDSNVFTGNISARKNVYLLERSALANVRGHIVEAHAGSFRQVDYDGTVFLGPPGGVVVFHDGNPNHPVVVSSVQVTAYQGGYNFGANHPSMTNIFVPTLDGEQAQVTYSHGQPRRATKEFEGRVEAKEKILVGHTPRLMSISPPNINITALPTIFYERDPNQGYVTRAVDLSVVNGRFSKTLTNTLGIEDVRGSSDPFSIMPGADIVVDVIIRAAIEYWVPYVIEVSPSTEWYPNIFSTVKLEYHWDDQHGVYKGPPLELLKIGRINRIRVKVLESGTDIPISNATVNILEPILNHAAVISTEDDYCTPREGDVWCAGGPFQFYLKDERFVAQDDINFQITITHPDFASFSEDWIAYEGMDEDIIIRLRRTNNGTPGGGTNGTG